MTTQEKTISIPALLGRALGAASCAGALVGLYVGVYLVTNNLVEPLSAKIGVIGLMAASYAGIAVLPLAALLIVATALSELHSGHPVRFGGALKLAIHLIACAVCGHLVVEAYDDLQAGYTLLRVVSDTAYWCLPVVAALLLTRLDTLVSLVQPRSAPRSVRTVTVGSILVATLLVLSVLPTSRSIGAARTPDDSILHFETSSDYNVSPAGGKVVLVGFDGIDPVLLDVFIANGHMPNFAKLKRTAAYSDLETSPEGLSPPIWTTFATGVGPTKHGIHDFFVRRFANTSIDFSALKNKPNGYAASRILGAYITGPYVTEEAITPAHRRAPALWTLAEKAGLHACVIDWMGTWPAESLSGAMISDRSFFAYNQGSLAVVTDDITGTALPLRLMSTDSLDGDGRDPELCSPEPLCTTYLPPISAEERVDVSRTADFHVAENDFYLRAAERLLPAPSCRGADLTVFYSHLPDFLNHMLVPSELDNLYAGNYAGEMESLSLHVYKEVDRTMGRLLELVGTEPTVLVVSDHGVEILGEGPTRVVSHFEGPPGIFFARPSRGRGAARIQAMPSIYEIVPTALALLGAPLPDYLDGRVISEVVTAELGDDATVRTIAMDLAPEQKLTAATADDESSHSRVRTLGYVE